MDITAEQVKKIREETGAPVMEIRRALMDANGDGERAKEILKERGLEKAAEREERETAQGLIEAYVHPDARVGALVHIACETDFVARTDEFKTLAHELAMQVASMNPQSVEELLKQEYIRDSTKKISELVSEVIAKTGENIQVKHIARFELGE